MTARIPSLALLALLALLPAAGLAQDPGADMAPAAELTRYQPMIGTWEGSGTVQMAPGAQAAPWTARTTCEWVLGNHFVREHMNVAFEGGMPPMEWTFFYGYDTQRKRFVTLGAGSMGSAEKMPIYWTGADTMVTVASGFAQGTPYADRSVTKFGKDSYTVTMHRIAAGGEPFVHVRGEFKRSQTAASGQAEEAAAAGAVQPEIAKLERLCGTWNVKGTMVMAPGQPEMPISGVESNRIGFGGQVLVQHVKGDPAPGMPAYEMWGFAAWDANDGAYDQVWVDNMGMFGDSEMRWSDADTLVVTTVDLLMGSPAVSRGTLKLSASGITKATNTSIVGAHDPQVTFQASYARAK